jgi:subtilase family protein
MPTRFLDQAGHPIKEAEMPPTGSLPFPNRFPDNRTDQQRANERREIQKQIDHLTRFPADGERQQKVMTRLARGRAARRLTPFAGLSSRRLPEVPALALREFVVRETDLARRDVQDVIQSAGLSAEPVAALGGEVVRLVRRPPAAPFSEEEFRAVAAEIKTVPITPNYLVPLGGWIKGEGGPEHTTARPDWRPPSEERIQVAVIDTGLGYRTDEWLQGLTNPEIDPLYPEPDSPTLGLSAGHGTFVAGIVQRVEPSTDIRMYAGLDVDGVGDDIMLAEKIVQAARCGAQIINLSLGTQTLYDQPPLALDVGIRQAIEINPDILIVCAAGNYGDSRKVWPAAFSLLDFSKNNVVAVAGLNPQGEKPEPEWSSHGDFVQISTIAEGVVSTYVEGIEDIVVENPPDKFTVNDFAIWSGTSFAAPQVAGAVASICLTKNLTPTEAIKTLTSGTPIPGYGVPVKILPGT